MVTPSGWAVERFGDAAGSLQEAVVTAIAEAHGDAVAAQAVSGTRRRDPYGHTLKNRQHECLVALVRDGAIPGAEVVHPRGASFDLVRISATNVVLFPWRYATDSQSQREDARMHPSSVRRDLLAGDIVGGGQLSLDHAAVEDEDLEAQLAEDEALAAELRSFHRVVTIGYASNPAGILDLGWGDAELIDDDGTVAWRWWEPLTALLAAGRVVDDRQSGAPSAGLRAAPNAASTSPAAQRKPRFDDAPLDEDFGLQPRTPLAGEPQQETGQKPGETGTGDDRP